MPDDPEWVQQARELARRGTRIQAIKLIRDRSGMGLRQAKELMELLATGAAVDPSALVSDPEDRSEGQSPAVLLLGTLAATVIAYLVMRWFGVGR